MTWPSRTNLAVTSGYRSTHSPTWKKVARISCCARMSAIWEVKGSLGPSSNVRAITVFAVLPRYGKGPSSCEYDDIIVQ